MGDVSLVPAGRQHRSSRRRISARMEAVFPPWACSRPALFPRHLPVFALRRLYPTKSSRIARSGVFGRLAAVFSSRLNEGRRGFCLRVSSCVHWYEEALALGYRSVHLVNAQRGYRLV